MFVPWYGTLAPSRATSPGATGKGQTPAWQPPACPRAGAQGKRRNSPGNPGQLPGGASPSVRETAERVNSSSRREPGFCAWMPGRTGAAPGVPAHPPGSTEQAVPRCPAAPPSPASPLSTPSPQPALGPRARCWASCPVLPSGIPSRWEKASLRNRPGAEGWRMRPPQAVGTARPQ